MKFPTKPDTDFTDLDHFYFLDFVIVTVTSLVLLGGIISLVRPLLK